ncbi:MAG: transcription elongation factor GreA [Phycisphaeraceae bacterium]|nr:MAG: transcription elongation factor GreA [Phycisphaeraceae bacterium]
MDVITQGDKSRLEGRLNELIANRSVITTRIAEARALGDLKENAEYHSAREQQGLEEAEIKRIETRLANAQLVSDTALADGVVFIGSSVKLREVGGRDDEPEVYRLVGEMSDDDTGEIIEVTTSSPMGEALMKSRVGETIRVNAPRGVKRFEILEIL